MLSMNVAFRVDASTQIGTGHLMRCLTLADALAAGGAYVRFVCRHLPHTLTKLIQEKAHDLVLFQGVPSIEGRDELAHAHWLGTTQAHDAQETLSVLSDKAWNWLIVDHYALDSRWESILYQIAKKILVIDDIADRQHSCEVLLDQNLYPNMDTRYRGKVSNNCHLLLGPRYALLRDEFKCLREQISPRTGEVKRILVFMGGVDADNYTAVAIESLASLNRDELSVDVIIGAAHPFREAIEYTCKLIGFCCHVQTNKMGELIASADLAIGAGGSANWERCCLGLPGLIVSLADNQIEIAKALDHFGACVHLGTPEFATPPVLRKALSNCLNDRRFLKGLSEKSYYLVDGLGGDRLCQVLSC